MAEKYGKKEEEIKGNEQLRSYIKENYKYEKTIEYIVENATIGKKKAK